MALLRMIHNKDIWWMYNNKPYVEPTEEQKRLQAEEAEARRFRLRQAEMKLACMLGTIESFCPGVIERTHKMMKTI